MTLRRKQRGAALLEFAMALPFALTLFIGISDFSIYFWRQTEMEDVARLTAAKLPQNLATATAGALQNESRTLQSELRKVSGRQTLDLKLTRLYACPLATGGEVELTSEPGNCANERVYLRVANDYPVEPILGPLRWLGFPKTAFSRHVVRLR